MSGTQIATAEAVIDNGAHGTRTVTIETGRLARQAAGSVTVSLDGGTLLLSATTASKNPKDQFDFFPLTVDVEERMYSVGRIPDRSSRPEGPPTEDDVLTCRLIDRPLRPTFKGLRNEVQVVVTVMSLNPNDLYDVVAINGASASTQLSGLPFSGPVGGVRIALIDGQWVGFPTHEQLETAVFDMVVAGRVAGDDVAIMMVEAEATDKTIDLVAGARKLPQRRSAVRAWKLRSPSFAHCVTRSRSWPMRRRSPSRTTLVFLEFEDDAYDAVERLAIAGTCVTRWSSWRRPLGKRVWTTSRPPWSPNWPRTSKAGRRNSRRLSQDGVPTPLPRSARRTRTLRSWS